MKSLRAQKSNVSVDAAASVRSDGEVAVFKLPQDARSSHTRLEEILGWMSTGGTPYLVLDLSGPMLASTQLGPAVAIRNAALTHGGKVRLVLDSEHCLGVLKQCQLAQLFEIFTTVDAACDQPWT